VLEVAVQNFLVFVKAGLEVEIHHKPVIYQLLVTVTTLIDNLGAASTATIVRRLSLSIFDQSFSRFLRLSMRTYFHLKIL